MSAFFPRERFWRQLHFYSALLLSLQLLAWFASGVVMSVLPIEQVRGEHLRTAAPEADWHTATLAPAQLLSQTEPIEQLALTQRGTVPVYRLQRGGKLQYIDARNGAMLAPLTPHEVQQLALARWAGDAAAATNLQIQQLATAPGEVRGLTGPLWQVQFADTEHSRFYLHAITGELLRVRTDTWRLYDFFWMLHIMDYRERSDFNHALLIAASSSALLFVLSALPLLWLRSKRTVRSSTTSISAAPRHPRKPASR